MAISKFTYSYIERIIEALKKGGYVISNYHNYNSYHKICIMRHDIDYDISKALEFARFERKNGVTSTYFILLSSDFYNIFSSKVLNKIDIIISLGHEIGLHFDETNYDFQGDKEKFICYVEEELYIMSRVIGKEIKVVSMHRPSRFSLESNFAFSKAINSYSKDFFKNFKYVSDSRMNWREDILSVIKSNEFDRIHLLTHPFWYSNTEESTKEKILRFVKNGVIFRYENMSENFRDIEEFVKKEDIT